ncbi:MAG TPA: Rrf2 family transcriptional regulator [Bryobacteraceae bacterium]|jgi:Rrf2 family protein|nr:Rrf2 family transcriptional regulator [Bryobacteraceae bacterium]
MLSQTTEYALRAMVALATSSSEALTAQEIAASSHIPLDYLSKVLSLLSRAGLVHSQRGRGGGFQAARPASELTVLEVVTAVDPLRRIKTCPLGLPVHGENLCPLHRKLDDAVRIVEEAFSATTIESLVGGTLCQGETCHAKAV